MDFEQYKANIFYNYVDHFTEGGGYPIRVNPFNQVDEPAEMLEIMFILECMPFLEAYESEEWDKEVMVRLSGKIPDYALLEYYREAFADAQESYSRLYDKVADLASEF